MKNFFCLFNISYIGIDIDKKISVVLAIDIGIDKKELIGVDE
jgi:hypothetical protein